MIYQDKYTRWHHKPVRNGNPSSDNGWIYSAYGRHILPDSMSYESFIGCLNKCTLSTDRFIINRSPEQVYPPFSRDEVMGLLSVFQNHSIGEELYKSLKNNHWNFCNLPEYKKEPLTLKRIWKAVKVLWGVRKEHRNHFWENELTDAYPLAFRLPPQDVIYLKMLYGDKVNWFEKQFLIMSLHESFGIDDKSGHMIAWLKVKDLGLDIKMSEAKYISTYFPENHPFVLTTK